MLVLSRKHNETLHIGNDIVITIVRVRGNSVRLGIQASKEVHIMRSELLGMPAKQTAVSAQISSQTHGGSETAPKSSERETGRDPSEKGPLAKFLRVVPRVELAVSS